MFSQYTWKYRVADRMLGRKIAYVVVTFNILDTLLCKLSRCVLQSRLSLQKMPTETGQVCNAQGIVDVAPSMLVHQITVCPVEKLAYISRPMLLY